MSNSFCVSPKALLQHKTPVSDKADQTPATWWRCETLEYLHINPTKKGACLRMRKSGLFGGLIQTVNKMDLISALQFLKLKDISQGGIWLNMQKYIVINLYIYYISFLRTALCSMILHFTIMMNVVITKQDCLFKPIVCLFCVFYVSILEIVLQCHDLKHI